MPTNVPFYAANILLPKEGHEKWACIACDQFTSQPEYWRRAYELADGAPSALHVIFPEVYLEDGDSAERISAINAKMAEYLKGGVFEEYKDALIYVERTLAGGRVRRGIVGAFSLADYNYEPGAKPLIRPTEGTVLSRIPPRVAIREKAPLELPHIMVFMDDRRREIIEGIDRGACTKLYDFELMLGGGHLCGWLLPEIEQRRVLSALARLADESGEDGERLLFAVGDGNHSLATAKACYAEQKKGKTPEEYLALPSRFALVEVVNNHDDALQFEPIHRVLFGVDHEKFMKAFQAAYPNAYEGKGEGHTIEFVWNDESHFITVPDPKVQLAVGTLQGVIDPYLKENGGEVDYIHGDAVTRELGSKPGNMGFLLPAMGKDQLFKTVMADGVLPRKTFSMGHAQDKRYYVEARKIVK